MTEQTSLQSVELLGCTVVAATFPTVWDDGGVRIATETGDVPQWINERLIA